MVAILKLWWSGGSGFDHGCVQYGAAPQDKPCLIELAIKLAKQWVQQARINQPATETAQRRMIRNGSVKAQSCKPPERQAIVKNLFKLRI